MKKGGAPGPGHAAPPCRRSGGCKSPQASLRQSRALWAEGLAFTRMCPWGTASTCQKLQVTSRAAAQDPGGWVHGWCGWGV